VQGKSRVLSWLEAGSDCLLVASRFDPLSLLVRLLPMLKPGRPFAVHCEFLAPLTDAMFALRKADGAVLNLVLTESWLREYQVLPARTHPNMSMSASGGYVLSGTVVAPRSAALAGAERNVPSRALALAAAPGARAAPEAGADAADGLDGGGDPLRAGGDGSDSGGGDSSGDDGANLGGGGGGEQRGGAAPTRGRGAGRDWGGRGGGRGSKRARRN
jgi:hypothetical protein